MLRGALPVDAADGNGRDTACNTVLPLQGKMTTPAGEQRVVMKRVKTRVQVCAAGPGALQLLTWGGPVDRP